MFTEGLIVGLFVGVPLGMVIMALCVAAGKADDRMENEELEYKKKVEKWAKEFKKNRHTLTEEEKEALESNEFAEILRNQED